MKLTRKGFFTTIIGAFAGVFGVKKTLSLQEVDNAYTAARKGPQEPINIYTSGEYVRVKSGDKIWLYKPYPNFDETILWEKKNEISSW